MQTNSKNEKYDPDLPKRVLYINAANWNSFDTAVRELARRLSPKKEERIFKGELNPQYMLESAGLKGRRPIYLFFDEVDDIIEHDSSHGWRFFKLLYKVSSGPNRAIRWRICRFSLDAPSNRRVITILQ